MENEEMIWKKVLSLFYLELKHYILNFYDNLEIEQRIKKIIFLNLLISYIALNVEKYSHILVRI